MKKSLIAAGITAAMLTAPAAASAHVTVNPREATPGAFTVMTVRVPNERDNKGTVKVDLRLPDGFYFLSYKKVPGWKAKLTRTRARRPRVDARRASPSIEQVTRVVWKGNPKKGGIIQPRPVRGVRALRPRAGRRRRATQLRRSPRSRPTAAANVSHGPAAPTPTSPPHASRSTRPRRRDRTPARSTAVLDLLGLPPASTPLVKEMGRIGQKDRRRRGLGQIRASRYSAGTHRRTS